MQLSDVQLTGMLNNCNSTRLLR